MGQLVGTVFCVGVIGKSQIGSLPRHLILRFQQCIIAGLVEEVLC